MIRRILFVLFIISSFGLFAQNGLITGRVFDNATGEPLPFASVSIWQSSKGTTTDIDGNFKLENVESGFLQLAASYVGYETSITDALWVTNAKPAFIEIGLKNGSQSLEEVVVKATPFVRDQESPLSLRKIDISEIEQMPGGNRDISKVIQSLPGVSSGVSYRNDVIVRGGGPSENVFYLDGIEIPNLNHFATQGASGGPVGIINVDFIREIELYSGAFPANRGNTLSSVIEMKMIDPNPTKPTFRFSFGASDLSASYNGPISKKSGLTFSYRRSYLQFLFSLIGLPFLPTYDDAQFKYKIRFDKKNELSFIGIGAYDRLSLNTGIKDPDEDQLYTLNNLPVNNQWTYTVGAVYKHFAKHGYHQLVLSHNRLYNEAYKYYQNNEVDSLKTLDYNSNEIETKLRYEHYYSYGGWTVNYGAGTEWDIYTNDTKQLQFINGSQSEFSYDTDIDFFQYSVFGQASRAFLQDRLSLSLGLRFDGASYSSEMRNPLDQFAPRFSASYSLAPEWSLNFNTGRYYQLPPYTTMGYKDNSGALINLENGLSYIRNDQLVAGIEWLPTDQSKITVEGFYKWYDKYPFSVADSVAIASKATDFGVFGTEEVVSTAKGHAYGVELLARNKDLFGFNLILSYTFVRSAFTDISGDFISSAWDNRHLLNVTLLRPLKRNWEVGAKYRFVGGAPYTPYDLAKSSYRPAWDVQSQPYLDYSRFNTERVGNFHQLDVRVDKRYFFDKWSLMLYIDIQNLLNFQQELQANVTNLDAEGNPDIVDSSLPYDQQYYNLRAFDNFTGTVLPTIGIMVEF